MEDSKNDNYKDKYTVETKNIKHIENMEDTTEIESTKHIENMENIKEADCKAEFETENLGGNDGEKGTDCEAGAKDMKDVAKQMVAMFTEVRQKGEAAIMSLGTGEWEPLISIIDSGSTVPVAPLAVGRGYPVIEGAAKRAGVCYAQADGTELPNLGEKVMAVVTQEGTLRGYTTQLADVTHALQSVRALMKSSHHVVFDNEGCFMVNKLTGEYNHIDDDGCNSS